MVGFQGNPSILGERRNTEIVLFFLILTILAMNDRKRREKEGSKSRGAKEKESAMIKWSRMREKERIKDETKRNKEEKIGASKNDRKKEENGRIEKWGRGKEEQKGVKAKKEREEGKTKKKKEEKEEEEEYYEDDFEDYESDFEADEGEDEGEKNNELAENGRDGAGEQPSLLLEKLAARGREKDEAIRSRRPDEQIGGNGGMEKGQKEIDFVISEQRELAIGRKGEEEGRGKKGSKEWMVEYFREVAGQSERRKQVGTQTDGPELSVGSQTESLEKEESGMQTGEMALEQKVTKGEENVEGPNRRRLAFLKEAGQLMSGLLRLSSADEPSMTPGNKNHSNLLPFSSGHSIFSLNSLFKENRPCAIALKNPQTICLCVFVSNSEDPMQMRKSFGAEISLENPSELRRLICADHEIIFLRYSPVGSFLFAAMKDGSLAAWELLNGDEIQMKGNKLDEAILKPIVNTAFSQLGKWETGGAAKGEENWADLGIVGMEMMRGRGGRTVAQLVVLHESGLIRCWAALEGAGNDALEWDGFGGATKTKLQLMATSNARCIPAAPTNTEFATSLAIDGQIAAFVGTSKGRILRINPINGKADWRDGPSVFNADPDGSSEVTSIKFPFSGKSDMFAAATMDQRVMLFSLAKTEPYRIVAANSSANHNFGLQMPILLEWSPIDQSILFSIHAGEEILVLRSEGKESFQFFREFRSRIHCTLGWADQSGNAFLAFGLSNGETHVHSLK